MIIEAINPFLVLDEFPNKGSTFAYLLSKPMSLKTVKYAPFLLIYTTPYIKRIIIKDLDDPLVGECIVTMNIDGIMNYLKMPNETEVEVKVCPTNSATQNVMFLFENGNNDGHQILYTGDFTEYRSIQANEHFIRFTRNGIDHLYIDNTLEDMDPLQTDNSIRKTCAAMADLIDRFEGHKFHLMLDNVGYEDLLIALAQIYDSQIYLDSFRSDIIPKKFQHMFSDSEAQSKIIVKNRIEKKTPLVDIEKKLVKEKVITVKFTNEECLWLSMLSNYRTNVYRGLCLIQYSPHPSPIELMDFILSANANEIHSIEHSK